MPSAPSTDEMIALVIEAGFLVNNLFQCNTKQWQANLRSPRGHTQFGVGATPADALDECLHKLNDLVPAQETLRPIAFTVEQHQSLRAMLGIGKLTTNHPPVNRRV